MLTKSTRPFGEKQAPASSVPLSMFTANSNASPVRSMPTRRFTSTSFTVVTGHTDPTTDDEVDWDALARVGGTIVILMGVRRWPAIAERLIAAGRSPDTPAAAVRWGTRPNQQTTRATLATLADHPLPGMLDAGLAVSIHSDDPAYFGGYVDDNHRAVREALGLDHAQVRRLADNAVDAAFVDDRRRAELRAEVAAWADQA